MDAGDEQAINTWVRQNAIPLQHIEAGNGFADLQPLKGMLDGAKVVGLGEATHGTREFFQIKHRLLAFLVQEMAFNRFAIEASYAACQPINEYVLHGTGDRDSVLTSLGYVPWDTEEFAAMLDWLRLHNESVAAKNQVRFYGVDLWRNELGREEVLRYLRRVAPDQVAAAGALFAVLAAEEAKWPRRIDAEAKETLQRILPQLQALIDHLAAGRDGFVRATSATEFDGVVQYATVMKQWAVANSVQGPWRRSFLAENMLYLINHDEPEARFVVWAHNGHLRLGNEGSIGARLREKYGQDYVAFGLEFSEGAFQTRTEAGTFTVLGDLVAMTVPAAPQGSLAWHLAQAKIGNLIVDLRVADSQQEITRWLQRPQTSYNAVWCCPEKYGLTSDLSPGAEYDAIVFVERTTPTRPTANALRTVAAREGL